MEKEKGKVHTHFTFLANNITLKDLPKLTLVMFILQNMKG